MPLSSVFDQAGNIQYVSSARVRPVTSNMNAYADKGSLRAENVLNGDVEAKNSIYTASSVDEIRASLAELSRREAAVTARLDVLLASQQQLTNTLARLDVARAHLGTQVVQTRQISNGMLASASATAARISSAVHNLDREQAAVKSTLDVVEQVAELKACLLGVSGSMGATRDWETAANYLSRASKIPDAVIDGAFAADVVPTAEVPDLPRVTLDAASESLCGLFLRDFEKAAREGDGTQVTRFFKLFPLIGRGDVGLDAYGRYVCTGIASRARSNLNTASASTKGQSQGTIYATALTRLFEHIAQIVDGHEPLVTRHYGDGSMAKVVERIQVEADLQGGIILDNWTDERRVNRKLVEVKSYPFNFLIQSFLPSSKPALGSTPRSGSPAPARKSESDDAVDMKEVDALLNESALMLGRWALYTRFLASKIGAPNPDKDDKLHVPSFIALSSLYKKTDSLLADPFKLLATFSFRRSVEKAFQLDESPGDLTLSPNKPLSANPPFITSAVDDVMYILSQTVQKTLSTNHKSVVTSVVSSISRVLSSDFFGVVQRKMRDESYPKAAIQGALPPESLIIQFLVLMNNLDVATDYVHRIVRTCLGTSDGSKDDNIAASFPFANEALSVCQSLKDMSHTFSTKTDELLTEATEVMLKQVMRPRLRPVLIDTFRDVDYLPSSSSEDADSEAEDMVSQRFEKGWQAFTFPIKRILTPSNYDRLLTATISYLARTLEKRVWSFHTRVNALGAVKLERDVAGIVSVAAKGGRYELRDLFARCVQITLVMNMEDDEWETVAKMTGEHLERETGVAWLLDEPERKKARGLVVR